MIDHTSSPQNIYVYFGTDHLASIYLSNNTNRLYGDNITFYIENSDLQSIIVNVRIVYRTRHSTYCVGTPLGGGSCSIQIYRVLVESLDKRSQILNENILITFSSIILSHI